MHQLSLPGGIARAQTPEALFAAVRADDAARALVTFYDDSTGERMELSAASLGNWVAKTHFLLTDELGLGPGDRAFVAVPMHWQRLVVWLGAWSAGLELVTRPDDAQVAFVSAERAAEAETVDEVFALALAPWGRGFEVPPGVAATDHRPVPRTSSSRCVHSRMPGDRCELRAVRTIPRWTG